MTDIPLIEFRGIGKPSKRYSPQEGLSSAPMMFMAVDLPEPDGPMMATNSPSWIVRSMLWSAVKAASPVP